MTILEIHRAIEQHIHKMGFFAYADLEHEEIDLQINMQIKLLLNGILDKHFGRPLKISEAQGFQKNQVTLDNLRKLHVGNQTVTLYTAEPGFVSFTLPENYYHHIKTTVTVSYPCYENGISKTETNLVDVRIAQSQNDSKNHPFYKTGRDSPLAEIIGTGVFIYYDSTFTIPSAKITYIKKPAVVAYVKDGGGNYDSVNSVQCDLDESLHEMLVNMTSIKILEILEAPQQKVVNSQREIV